VEEPRNSGSSPSSQPERCGFFAALFDRKRVHFPAETAPAILEHGRVWPLIPGGGIQEVPMKGVAIFAPVSLLVSLPKPESYLHCALPISEQENLRGSHYGKDRRRANAWSHHE
jgi:hypothetical protein